MNQTTRIHQTANVPMQFVGPLKIMGNVMTGEVMAPLATYESPLWATCHRGARVTRESSGIQVTFIDDRMTRAILLEADSASLLYPIVCHIKDRGDEMQTIVSKTSRFAKLINLHSQIVGSLLYLRFEFTTGDASGHNMVTLASDHLVEWLLAEYPVLHYVSISGNLCTDKKTSVVNGILGRGKYMIAEAMIPAYLCKRFLRTTPEKIVDLNTKKNLLGGILAGSIRTANAHFANILLGFYLATGQDAANIVEGSQGIVFAEVRDQHLYFSATIPNIIVGTVGSGKSFDFVKHNLQLMGCDQSRKPGDSAKRLAAITAALVLCGELSLLAAQTNRGELMRAHATLERKENKEISTT